MRRMRDSTEASNSGSSHETDGVPNERRKELGAPEHLHGPSIKRATPPLGDEEEHDTNTTHGTGGIYRSVGVVVPEG